VDLAVILAGAGSGTRMGGLGPKLLIPVGGRPALERVIDAFADVTGGQRARVRLPKTVNGYVWFDDERRAFLVERMANPQGPECEKRVFLFQYAGKRSLVFDNTSAPASMEHS